LPELRRDPPPAGYQASLDRRAAGVVLDEAVQRVLVEREKVAVMGGAVYGAPGFVRLNVGCPRAKVERGVEALIRAVRTVTSSPSGV
nr:aminotransferase class I/II-fold pyridoxal phosphate-dependent enzyme [Streptomyces sp. DSM 41633]